MPKYWTVRLPYELVEDVEQFIKTTELGRRYSSVPEFIKEAIREKLERMEREERMRRAAQVEGVVREE